MKDRIERRCIKRDGLCDGCSKILPRHTEILTIQSMKSGTTLFFLCKDCAKSIGELS